MLVVGGRIGELDGWGRPPTWGPARQQKVIQVDIDPTSIGLNRPVELGIVGDARTVLASAAGSSPEAHRPRARSTAALRATGR